LSETFIVVSFLRIVSLSSGFSSSSLSSVSSLGISKNACGISVGISKLSSRLGPSWVCCSEGETVNSEVLG